MGSETWPTSGGLENVAAGPTAEVLVDGCTVGPCLEDVADDVQAPAVATSASRPKPSPVDFMRDSNGASPPYLTCARCRSVDAAYVDVRFDNRAWLARTAVGAQRHGLTAFEALGPSRPARSFTLRIVGCACCWCQQVATNSDGIVGVIGVVARRSRG
jgi:hypothetical protein